MNIPNILTIFRLILTIVFIVFLYQDGLTSKVIAFGIFTLASITDFLDGYIARKHDLISAFGKIMDPIADKFLMLSAFFIFMQMHIIAAWMFIIIAVREILITVLRLIVVGRGKALAAEATGKLKTVLQIVAVYLIMIFIIVAQVSTDASWQRTLIAWLTQCINIFMLGVVLITLWSGVMVIYNSRKEILRVR